MSVSGEIHSLEDGLRVVAAMMRHHHACGSWVQVAERLEEVAENPDVCPLAREDAVQAARIYLKTPKTAVAPTDMTPHTPMEALA